MYIPVKPVESSDVKAAGYDPSAEIMRIAFLDGGEWDYHGVTPNMAEEFEDAESKGKFVADVLKVNCPVSKVEY